MHVPASIPLFILFPCMICLPLFPLLIQLLPSFAVLLGFFYPTLNTLNEPQASHLTFLWMRLLVPVCRCYAFILMLDDKYSYLYFQSHLLEVSSKPIENALNCNDSTDVRSPFKEQRQQPLYLVSKFVISLNRERGGQNQFYSLIASLTVEGPVDFQESLNVALGW